MSPAWGGGRLRRQLEEALASADRATTTATAAQAETQRLATMLDALDLGLMLTDATGVIVYRNQAAQHFENARHGDALVDDAMEELLHQALSGREAHRELELFGPPRRTLDLRAVPLGHGGAAGFIDDVSALRRVESVRRDFVANVSHELKTPVGALVALAETLEGDDDPVVMVRLAARVREEAERLQRLVQDLLDLSIVESQESPRRESVDLTEVVTEAVGRIQAAAEAAGIAVEVDAPPTPVPVACDRRQMVSAVFNLLDNAVKYSEEDGPPVEVRVTTSEGSVTLAVQDHGVGIPERDRERIFERFYRVDRARARATGGTGLGLAIVRHVVQAHGGAITLDSEEGVGTTFTVTLPGGSHE